MCSSDLAVVAGVVGIGVEIDFVVKLFERRGELVFEHELRDARRRAARVPEHNVQNDLPVKRVAMVGVVKPVVGAQVNLDIPGQLLAANPHCGVAKIGPRFEVPPAGKDDFHRASVRRLQAGCESFVVPDALHEPFADRQWGCGFAE